MKRNRILALTLAVLLLACCLTACSSAAKTSASYAEMPAAAALTEETAGTAADTVNTFVATDNAAASEASKTASASGTSAAEGQTADTAPTAESMDFEPILDRSARTDLGFLKSDQHQVFGRFTGRVTLDGGDVLPVREFFGFAEKVENKW